MEAKPGPDPGAKHRPVSPPKLDTDDRPPFLGSWRRVYALLVIVLAVEIAFMYWLTVHFA